MTERERVQRAMIAEQLAAGVVPERIAKRVARDTRVSYERALRLVQRAQKGRLR